MIIWPWNFVYQSDPSKSFNLFWFYWSMWPKMSPTKDAAFSLNVQPLHPSLVNLYIKIAFESITGSGSVRIGARYLHWPFNLSHDWWGGHVMRWSSHLTLLDGNAACYGDLKRVRAQRKRVSHGILTVSVLPWPGGTHSNDRSPLLVRWMVTIIELRSYLKRVGTWKYKKEKEKPLNRQTRRVLLEFGEGNATRPRR